MLNYEMVEYIMKDVILHVNTKLFHVELQRVSGAFSLVIYPRDESDTFYSILAYPDQPIIQKISKISDTHTMASYLSIPEAHTLLSQIINYVKP